MKKDKNFKKWQIISVFGIFLLSSLLHFIYDWFPNFFTSLLFPVNESIWEHNKIIFGSFFIWMIIEKIKFKDKNIISGRLIASFLCSIIVILVFTPIYLYILKTNDNIIVTFIIYFIAIAISTYIGYLWAKKDYNKKYEVSACFLWTIPFILNGILTYYPGSSSLFYDFTKNIYGIKK